MNNDTRSLQWLIDIYQKKMNVITLDSTVVQRVFDEYANLDLHLYSHGTFPDKNKEFPFLIDDLLNNILYWCNFFGGDKYNVSPISCADGQKRPANILMIYADDFKRILNKKGIDTFPEWGDLDNVELDNNLSNNGLNINPKLKVKIQAIKQRLGLEPKKILAGEAIKVILDHLSENDPTFDRCNMFGVINDFKSLCYTISAKLFNVRASTFQGYYRMKGLNNKKPLCKFNGESTSNRKYWDDLEKTLII